MLLHDTDSYRIDTNVKPTVAWFIFAGKKNCERNLSAWLSLICFWFSCHLDVGSSCLLSSCLHATSNFLLQPSLQLSSIINHLSRGMKNLSSSLLSVHLSRPRWLFTLLLHFCLVLGFRNTGIVKCSPLCETALHKAQDYFACLRACVRGCVCGCVCFLLVVQMSLTILPTRQTARRWVVWRPGTTRIFPAFP